MPILNYTTVVPVSQTIGEIHKILTRRGVERIWSILTPDGNVKGLGFTLRTPGWLGDYELPVRVVGVLSALRNDAKVPKSIATFEQADRVAWRIAKDWLEAQMALVDAQMADIAEVMLPYLITSDGRTTYQAFAERLQIASAEGIDHDE